MTRTLRLGSRRSALARVQAHQVGLALQTLDPTLTIDYRFIESSGDRSAEPNAGLVTARGGFSEDLGVLLDQGAIDLAVHSWKDLPLGERANTMVAATLARADARDVLLIRKDALARCAAHGLKILSSSARRRHHLEEFLTWALPARPAAISFTPVRGDIETRLRKLLRGDGAGLVIAKAAIDRLLAATPEQLNSTATDSAARLRQTRSIVFHALDACRAMVLPLLYCPAAPAQGALAVEVPVSTPYASLWRELNHPDSFDLVSMERAMARQFHDDEPLGLTRLRFSFGDIEFMRGSWCDRPEQRIKLLRFGPSLPRPRDAAAIWDGEPPETNTRIRELLPLPRDHFDAHTGLLVARAEALPETSSVDEGAILWTPGLTTWRKLAARGYWVVGSDESLGETAAASIRTWYPQTKRWLKLSHQQGYLTEQADLAPRYRTARRTHPEDVTRYSHFFWQSGTQLREYLNAFPALTQAWHGCGPGNTWKIARQLLGENRVQPFLNANQFRQELLA